MNNFIWLGIKLSLLIRLKLINIFAFTVFGFNFTYHIFVSVCNISGFQFTMVYCPLRLFVNCGLSMGFIGGEWWVRQSGLPSDIGVSSWIVREITSRAPYLWNLWGGEKKIIAPGAGGWLDSNTRINCRDLQSQETVPLPNYSGPKVFVSALGNGGGNFVRNQTSPKHPQIRPSITHSIGWSGLRELPVA